MYTFSLWEKTKSPRWYPNPKLDENPYISFSKGCVQIFGGTDDSQKQLASFAASIGVPVGQQFSRSQLEIALAEFIAKPKPKSNISSSTEKTPKKQRVDRPILRSSSKLYSDSLELDLRKVPFKIGTLDKLEIIVDSREPKVLQELFNNSHVAGFVTVKSLPIGDILIRDKESGAELTIERKTAPDFYSSIISTHAHHQAERLYDYREERRMAGIRCSVIWLIEATDDGAFDLYNSLPEIKQVDGMVSYILGVLDMQLCTTYSTTHTVYLIQKLAQCFIERQLFYGVKSDNGRRIDRLAKDRTHESVYTVPSTNKGVTVAGRSLEEMLLFIPGITKPIAADLAASGKSFKEITQMTKDELVNIKGVGLKLATKIFEAFNAR